MTHTRSPVCSCLRANFSSKSPATKKKMLEPFKSLPQTESAQAGLQSEPTVKLSMLFPFSPLNLGSLNLCEAQKPLPQYFFLLKAPPQTLFHRAAPLWLFCVLSSHLQHLIFIHEFTSPLFPLPPAAPVLPITRVCITRYL